MSLEYLVRPFVSRDVTPPRIIQQSADDNDANLRLELGRNGTGVKTLSGSSNATLTKYMDAKSKEFSRKEDDLRIENPDDPSQYVDVKVTRELVDKDGAGVDYQKTTTKFDSGGDLGGPGD